MTPDTDMAIILRLFREGNSAAAAAIAAETGMPLYYVCNVIDRLRDSGVLPAAVE